MAQQKRRPNTMVYGNLAYDLDTLASQRQLEEAARPERQSQPQQAPRHRTAARPRQRVSPLVLCAMGALAAMAHRTKGCAGSHGAGAGHGLHPADGGHRIHQRPAGAGQPAVGSAGEPGDGL